MLESCANLAGVWIAIAEGEEPRVVGTGVFEGNDLRAWNCIPESVCAHGELHWEVCAMKMNGSP